VQDISDKEISKLIRSWIGYRPDIDGNYRSIEIESPKQAAAKALAEALQKAEAMRNEAIHSDLTKSRDVSRESELSASFESVEIENELINDFAR
jgi:hypothetical protein